MGKFELSLKNIAAAALIIVCAALVFWGLGQNENSVAHKTGQADFAAPVAAQQPVRRVSPAPGREPVMPKGFKANISWRDPFAAPAEITGARPQAAPPALPGAAGSLVPPDSPLGADLPSLVGIVSSGNRQRAIIRHKGVSRTYSEGEQAGNYRLIQIAEDAVILQADAGKLTIRLP